MNLSATYDSEAAAQAAINAIFQNDEDDGQDFIVIPNEQGSFSIMAERRAIDWDSELDSRTLDLFEEWPELVRYVKH